MKTPTLFVCVHVFFLVFCAKQNETGDVDSALRPRLYVCRRWRWGMTRSVCANENKVMRAV